MQRKAMETEVLTDIVGIREAASQLGVAASTISRQVRAGIIPNRGTGEAPKVSISEARTARAKNTDPAQRRRPAPSGDDRANDGSFHAQRAERERVSTELKKLELAERTGVVIPKDAAENALFTFGRRIREELTNRWTTFAQDIAGLPAEEIARIGAERDEKLLTLIANEIEKDHDLLSRPSDRN